ncbi:chitobiase/beta-hexosaminidase C-terminal domain-containing protein [Methanobacterium oryzae]|uniref:chitobiase/beta-hexosaminidase C-terminal domain-containing protein n=1 Tax=Methanobacterium oryzae TaxID=69540 RepID=UPI003D1BBE51
MIFFSGAVCATDITVNPEDSIQTAIDNANDGDTLNLTAGTYNQCNITINKSLTISGPQTSGSPTAIIDAQNKGWIFNITSGITVNLKYLTIMNGKTIGYGGGIYSNSSNLTIIGSNVTNNMANDGAGLYNNYGNCTIINSSINYNNAFNRNGGGIYNYGYSTNLIITGSNIDNNHATASGGGIWNHGSCTIINSSVSNNIANYNGGGILNSGGICNITNSIINNNNATLYSGGGIDTANNLIVTNSSISNNIAGQTGGGIRIYGGTGTISNSNIKNNTANIDGGGICNYVSLNITGSNFELNNATGKGNAIFNDGYTSNAILHFNRFYDTATGYEIYCNNGTVNATLNWWGSNLNPSSKVYGNVTVNPWLVLNINATPTTIKNGMNSIITADLTKDSNGLYHDPASGHIPDGIPVGFITTLGTIYNLELPTVNGIAQATLNGGPISGDATVTAAVDYQSLQTTISIDNITPTAYANSKGGLYNYNKNVRLYMNELGTIYYTLNGSTPTISSIKYTGGPILISSTTTLKFIAMDLTGNLSPVYTEKYTIDKVRPTITSVSIKNGATVVSRTSTIVIKFSENIKTSINWNKFYVKNLSTGKTVSISKWISGNTLYLKTTNTRAAYTWYQVYIPGYSVKDSAGNNLAVGYWFKFQTGKY